MTDEPEPTPKRKRRTKAAVEEERAAQAAADAAKPIDPMIWIILGVLILFVAAWTWIDAQSFADAGQTANESILQLVPDFLIGIFGKTFAVLILVVLGGIPLVWGIIGWLKKRFGSANTP